MVDFNNYCKNNNIILFCMFIHSFHIFQFFDIKYFRFFKVSYSKKIKQMICMQIMHITKNNFFFVFKHVFYVIINPKNIQTSFKIIGFILCNLEKMISGLDFKFYMLTLLNFHPTNFTFINPNMLCIAKNVVQNSINLKNKIVKHQSNFFIHLYELIDTQTKNISKLMHKMMLFKIKNKIFYTANELFNK